MDDRHLIIFDGVCNFCNGSVNFIIRHDSQGQFVFTPMQSDLAQQKIDQYGITNVGVDTFLLIKNDQCYVRTDAALEITKDLDGYWKIMRFFRIVPRPIRDFFYRFFARNRYAIFGRSDACIVPSDEVKNRFVGIN